MFYPKRRPRGFDELTFYAEHFDTVEVNSTFYGQPRVEVCRGWAERTPPGFEFSVKLYQKFTHPGMFKVALVKGISRAEAHGAATSGPEHDTFLNALIRPTEADLDAFRRGIDPLASSGKLGALLAQFPASFKDSPESREYLEQLVRALRDYPIAVEAPSPYVDDSWSANAVPAERRRRRVGADRRTQVPLLDRRQNYLRT